MSELKFDGDARLRTTVRRVSRWGTLCGLLAVLTFVPGCPTCETDEECMDDGLFCTGDEFCNDMGMCDSEGDPCVGLSICDEPFSADAASLREVVASMVARDRSGGCPQFKRC